MEELYVQPSGVQKMKSRLLRTADLGRAVTSEGFKTSASSTSNLSATSGMTILRPSRILEPHTREHLGVDERVDMRSRERRAIRRPCTQKRSAGSACEHPLESD